MKRISLALLGLILAGAGCTQTPPVGQDQSPSPTPSIAVGEPNPSQPKPEEVKPAQTGTVNIYMVALEDAGKSGKAIGCGDSVVPVKVNIQNAQTPLSEAVKELLKVKTEFYGQSGLYNALYQSNLQLASAAIVNGKATVKLTGTHVLGGTCDTPRFEEQIRETVLQFPTVNSAEIFLNGKLMEDVLSAK